LRSFGSMTSSTPLRAAGVSFEDRQDLLGYGAGRITTHYSAVELTRLIEAANEMCEQDQRYPLTMLRGLARQGSRKTHAREEAKTPGHQPGSWNHWPGRRIRTSAGRNQNRSSSIRTLRVVFTSWRFKGLATLSECAARSTRAMTDVGAAQAEDKGASAVDVDYRAAAHHRSR
jgi:hypothetical protein